MVFYDDFIYIYIYTHTHIYLYIILNGLIELNSLNSSNLLGKEIY